MNKIEEIATYVSLKTTQRLSLNRFRQFCYLIDWFSLLADDKQMTNIEYSYRFYLDTPQLDHLIKYSSYLKIEKEVTMLSMERLYVSALFSTAEDLSLTDREKQIIDVVVEKVDKLFYKDLVNYVLSTYPFNEETQYIKLDIKQSAERYRRSTMAN